ncbi:helix-turn-helix domain-containing protein [Mycobacterium spongiae]|uniref:helix-turn-helix domain-containing protein n=1 Tax=Mycobacterium spongiae TaxID=886343 RepID=UPI0024849815|nr:helix-turn-helix domain-containing protein [Mycobacterium spongiae]
MVEFLTVRERPQSSAEIADGLGLSRSTVGAILAALDEQGWVVRLPDRTYRLGPGLIAIGERARPMLPHPDVVHDELDGLARRVGCAVGLSTVHGDQLIVVALAARGGRVPAGFASGTRLPLEPPGGASIIAFADEAEQDAWLARSKPDDAPRFRRVLEVIRQTGVGVWGASAADIETVDVIADVVSFLSAHPASAQLRDRLLSRLSSLAGNAYEPAQLSLDDELPVSVITTPVFGAAGRAQWELQVGPFKSAVSREERKRIIDELLASAARLARPEPDRAAGGHRVTRALNVPARGAPD